MRSRRLLAIALLVLGIPLLLGPLEASIHRERAALKYGGAGVTPAMRDRLGQGAAIALLAGFRGVVADFLWIQNHGFWEERQWIRMYRNMQVVTLLQPQAVTFWDLSSWHMAWNIAYAVRTDPANHTEAEGIRREREWQEKARDFLLEGIRNVPQRYDLYFALGWLYARKFKDPCAACEYYKIAAAMPDAPNFVDRMYAHALEHCGRLPEAYAYWKFLWQQRHVRHYPDHVDITGYVEREVRRLEGQLRIPPPDRVFPPAGQAR
jgi:hypothetical protein